MGLGGVAQARKLVFPLLGLEVAVPDGFTIDQAGATRVNLSAKSTPVTVSLYRIEFGNLEKLTPAHEQKMLHLVRQRLGKGGKVDLATVAVGGRHGRKLTASGNRAGAPWGVCAAYCFRGGQATVIEVLYPIAQKNEAQELFNRLCAGLVWLQPDRG